ncbi:MAG: hypothetical protein ABIQ52_18280 [Vicinamibacterales bacterium]
MPATAVRLTVPFLVLTGVVLAAQAPLTRIEQEKGSSTDSAR